MYNEQKLINIAQQAPQNQQWREPNGNAEKSCDCPAIKSVLYQVRIIRDSAWSRRCGLQ